MQSVSQVQVLGAGVDAMPSAKELRDPHGPWLRYHDVAVDEAGMYSSEADKDELEIVELLTQRDYKGALAFVNSALADFAEDGWDAVVAVGPDPLDFVERWTVWVRYVEAGND